MSRGQKIECTRCSYFILRLWLSISRLATVLLFSEPCFRRGRFAFPTHLPGFTRWAGPCFFGLITFFIRLILSCGRSRILESLTWVRRRAGHFYFASRHTQRGTFLAITLAGCQMRTFHEVPCIEQATIMRLRPFVFVVSTPGRSGQPLFFAIILCLVFLLMIFGCSQTPSAARTPPCTWEHFIVAPDIVIDVTNKVGPPKPVDTDFWMKHNWPNLPFPLEFYGSDDDNH